MTDNGDQAALNALVNDCYPDGWPWKIGDLVVDEEVEFSAIVEILDNTIYTPHDGWTKEQKRYPYAGTWVEGWLRELIMAIERVKSVHINDYGKLCTIEVRLKALPWRLYYQGPTPITALAAALRVLKQKEVGGAT